MMLHFCVLYVDFIKYKVWLTGICLLQAPLITIFLGAHLQPGFPNTTLTLQRSLMKQFCGQGLQQPFPASGVPQQVTPDGFTMKRMFLTHVLILGGKKSGLLRSIVGEAQIYNWKNCGFANSVDWMRIPEILTLEKSILGHQRSRKKNLQDAWFLVAVLCQQRYPFFTLRLACFWNWNAKASSNATSIAALRNERIQQEIQMKFTSGKFSRIMKIWSPSLQMKVLQQPLHGAECSSSSPESGSEGPQSRTVQSRNCLVADFLDKHSRCQLHVFQRIWSCTRHISARILCQREPWC